LPPDALSIGPLDDVVDLAHERVEELTPVVGQVGDRAPKGRGNPSGLTPGEQAAHWLRLQHPQGRDCEAPKSPPAPRIGLTCGVRFFGLVDLSLLEAVELFVRREDAERTLGELVRDEPEWESLFRIEEFELGEVCWN
jgi:hypothetical protein